MGMEGAKRWDPPPTVS